MITYIYDGSFDGLLTAIHTAFYSDIKPSHIVRREDFLENFLIEKVSIETDTRKAKDVYRAIEKKISPQSLKKIFYAYLSEREDSPMLILRYLQLGFKLGPEVDLNLANEDVLNMEKLSRLVGKERHRVTGILRFKSIKKDILYAQIEPDHNIIALLAPHFQARLRNENFIIHDSKREIGVFYNKKEWIVKDIEKLDPSLVKESEEIYEELWKTYFKSISIERKTNPKLQKRNMPMRYWKYLTEKK